MKAPSEMIKEYAWASEAISEMEVAADFHCYEKAWLEFLHHDRAWNKPQKLPIGISQQTLILSTAGPKEDTPFHILMHARNVDEHTTRGVVAMRSPEKLDSARTGAIGFGLLQVLDGSQC